MHLNRPTDGRGGGPVRRLSRFGGLWAVLISWRGPTEEQTRERSADGSGATAGRQVERFVGLRKEKVRQRPKDETTHHVC